MLTAVVFLLAGALGAHPASGATSASGNFAAPTTTTDFGDVISAQTGDGEVRLNLSEVHFERDTKSGAVLTSGAGGAAETADQKNAFAMARLPEPPPTRERLVKAAMDERSKRAWVALAFAEHGAAAFDAYSTRISVGHGNVEEDPLMKPFAHSAAIYAATQVTPLVLDIVARHMQRSESPFLRRVWWLPQSMETGMSIFAGVHNLGIAGGGR